MLLWFCKFRSSEAAEVSLQKLNQTRLVSVCVPWPRSLILAWQRIVHFRNELTSEAERLLRGKAKAQMAWVTLT